MALSWEKRAATRLLGAEANTLSSARRMGRAVDHSSVAFAHPLPWSARQLPGCWWLLGTARDTKEAA